MQIPVQLLHLLAPLGLALAPHAATQESAPVQERTPLVYVVEFGEAEVGRETVLLAADGWSAEGSFDFAGLRAGEYEARLRRGADGRVELDLDTTDGGKAQQRHVVAEAGRLVVTAPGEEGERSSTFEGEAFLYEDLLWACTIDLGAILVRRAQADEAAAGTTVTALSGAAARPFPVELLESSALPAGEGGAVLHRFRLKLAGAVELEMVCDGAGIPQRIAIPSQLVRVVLEGSPEPPAASGRAPTSIVDAGAWREKLSAPEHEVLVERDVPIEMPDGAQLVADVYRPAGEGHFPTILVRTPYNRRTEGLLKGMHYARRGYAFVAQDVRGRFASGGEWAPFVHETADGSATIDWIAEQPWSDGQVGMVGASYVGLVQWLAAKSGNPHLVCIVPQVSPPDPQENFPYEGGAFLLAAAWWGRILESMDHGTDWAAGIDWPKAYAKLPLGDLDQAVGLTEQTFLDRWLAHPPHDTEFWEPASYQASFGSMSVPALHVTGWWDGDQPGALQNFPGMRERAKTAFAREHQYLVVGPWTHFFNSTRSIGEVDYGDEAVVDLDARILRFFDRYLKGVRNGIDEEPPVHVFTMGTNRWHGESGWPLPQTRFTPLYLASDGDASTFGGNGRLALAAGTGSAARDAYRYDPLDVPELEIDFTDLSGAEATEDQSDQEDRADDLEYTSPPLAAACEIVGPLEVVLWVESDAEDTDFAAELYRRAPDGALYVIHGGVQRLRYAQDARRDAPVPPGTVTRVAIDCWATGLRLQKGERIVVRVTSWAWPGYGRNLNTLEPQAGATRAVVATNSVLHDAEHPSHLLLPVVPRADAGGLAFE